MRIYYLIFLLIYSMALCDNVYMFTDNDGDKHIITSDANLTSLEKEMFLAEPVKVGKRVEMKTLQDMILEW